MTSTLNVDTLSKEKWTKTIINKEEPRKRDEDMTDEEKTERYKKFINENQSLIKNFGMLKHYDDSKKYLTEHPQLVCEDTANYLVVWCIDLEIEDRNKKIKIACYKSLDELHSIKSRYSKSLHYYDEDLVDAKLSVRDDVFEHFKHNFCLFKTQKE